MFYKINSIILFGLLALFFFSACKKEIDSPILYEIAIVKISDKMKEQVFVSPIVDSVVVDYANSIPNLNILYYDDGLVLCNPTGEDSIRADFAKYKLNIIGTNPYISLENGYAVINWKWANFHPLTGAWRRPIYSNPAIINHKQAQMAYSTNYSYLNGVLANEEYYLLAINWEEVTDLNAIWPMAQGQQIEKPEIRYIYVMDVQKYGHLKLQNIDVYEPLAAYNEYVNNPKGFIEYVEERDRLQSSYVEILNRMINNNDLEKWTRKYK